MDASLYVTINNYIYIYIYTCILHGCIVRLARRLSREILLAQEGARPDKLTDNKYI